MRHELSGERYGRLLENNVLAFDETQITSAENRSNPQFGDPCHGLSKGARPPAITFQSKASSSQSMNPGEVAPTLDKNKTEGTATISGAKVRRLLPVECARLQGFPDTYLDIQFRGKPAADGNKYRSLGNSMAVPVMAYLGRRIEVVEAAQKSAEVA